MHDWGPLCNYEYILHVGKKFNRDGSHCTTGENQKGGRSRCATWEKIVEEGRSWADVDPTLPPGMNLHVVK